MSYHFPNERRVIERRRAPAAAFGGPDRRLADRRVATVPAKRKPEPINRGVLWASALMVFIVVDSVCLDGAYRHGVFAWLNDCAAATRDWSAHVWDWGH